MSPHLHKRMVDRRFTEMDLRRMLDRAIHHKLDIIPDRWVIETRHRRQKWEIIVEPDPGAKVLVVVTAYPVTSRRQ